LILDPKEWGRWGDRGKVASIKFARCIRTVVPNCKISGKARGG
jgi:hypothetical protein